MIPPVVDWRYFHVLAKTVSRAFFAEGEDWLVGHDQKEMGWHFVRFAEGEEWLVGHDQKEMDIKSIFFHGLVG